MIRSGSKVVRHTRASSLLISPIQRVRTLLASGGTLESLRQNIPRSSSKRVRRSGFPAAFSACTCFARLATNASARARKEHVGERVPHRTNPQFVSRVVFPEKIDDVKHLAALAP